MEQNCKCPVIDVDTLGTERRLIERSCLLHGYWLDKNNKNERTEDLHRGDIPV